MKYSIVGAGAIGSALASRFIAKRFEVGIANSKGPDSLAGLVRELGSRLKPITTTEALQADVVFLAIPFDAVPNVVKGVDWKNRILVDATNAIDFPAFTPRDLQGRLSTHIVAESTPGARVVKAFNTLPAAILAADPDVFGGRRALFISGDESDARQQIVELGENLGFAAVDLGEISAGGRAQQFGGGLSGKDFIQFG